MITRLVCTGAVVGIDAYENIARRSFLPCVTLAPAEGATMYDTIITEPAGDTLPALTATAYYLVKIIFLRFLLLNVCLPAFDEAANTLPCWKLHNLFCISSLNMFLDFNVIWEQDEMCVTR